MLQGEHPVLGRDIDDCSGAIVNGKGQAICYCHYNGVQWQLYECAFYDVFTPLKRRYVPGTAHPLIVWYSPPLLEW